MDFSEYVAARRTGLVRAAVLLGCPRPDGEVGGQVPRIGCARGRERPT